MGEKEKQGARGGGVMYKNSPRPKFARFLSICGGFASKVVRVIIRCRLSGLKRLISLRVAYGSTRMANLWLSYYINAYNTAK